MNLFEKIKIRRPRSSKFDLSHERKLSLDFGNLTPMLLEEVVPGDKFQVSSEIMLRLAPMIAPVMHRVNVYTHYFFVPNRIVWNEWEDFITGGTDGTALPAHPRVQFNEANKANFGIGSLSDYFGLPTVDPTVTVSHNANISALPFRAYQMIFNEYYRDQTLSPEINFDITSGDITDPAKIADLLSIRKRSWEKDRNTSALPFPQRGADVLLPVDSTFSPQYRDPAIVQDGTIATPNSLSKDTQNALFTDTVGTATLENLVDPQVVDSTSVTINELRQAVRLQEWLEKNARAGARFKEQILAHFGVVSDDARLQRPEYLGGGKQPIVISEVLSTIGEPATTPQGNMSGHGISVGNSHRFRKRFKEHGYVVGIMSVLPRTAYQDYIEKHWQKFDKFDHYFPEFANLGEQEIINREVFFDPAGDSSTGAATFGYTPRYSEYKYRQCSVHGQYRTTLDHWHWGRQFATQPSLNDNFVSYNHDKRIFAIEDPAEQSLYCQIYNNVRAIRPMPYFGTPRL